MIKIDFEKEYGSNWHKILLYYAEKKINPLLYSTITYHEDGTWTMSPMPKNDDVSFLPVLPQPEKKNGHIAG